MEIDVPLGVYKVVYATGKTWYGYENLFGPKTSYSVALETFNFYQEGDRVSGYTITLYKVTNGNLETKKIDKNQF